MTEPMRCPRCAWPLTVETAIDEEWGDYPTWHCGQCAWDSEEDA